MQNERIYLIGMPGCGKSTEGKKLARKLGWSFLDLDAEVEKEEGQSIEQIFSTLGELAFRKNEQVQLKKTFHLKRYIIACGGGTISFDNNMQLIKDNGISMYLNASNAFILQRILASKQSRPLFNGLSEVEITVKIKEIQESRKPFYEQASLLVNIPKESGKPMLDKALEAIRSFEKT
ncbi:MAG: shikimate kinase [Bacteroidetes bacterium B1(2017)]|nr:MAG: shikimate kinase [Bacteroidetes bacterium B1(2017)]